MYMKYTVRMQFSQPGTHDVSFHAAIHSSRHYYFFIKWMPGRSNYLQLDTPGHLWCANSNGRALQMSFNAPNISGLYCVLHSVAEFLFRQLDVDIQVFLFFPVVEAFQGTVGRFAIFYELDVREAYVPAYQGQFLPGIEMYMVPRNVGIGFSFSVGLVRPSFVVSFQNPFEPGERQPQDPSGFERSICFGEKNHGVTLAKVFQKVFTEAIFKTIVGKRVGSHEVNRLAKKPWLCLEEQFGIDVQPPFEHLKSARVVYFPVAPGQIEAGLSLRQLTPIDLGDPISELAKAFFQGPLGEAQHMNLHSPCSRGPGAFAGAPLPGLGPGNFSFSAFSQIIPPGTLYATTGFRQTAPSMSQNILKHAACVKNGHPNEHLSPEGNASTETPHR
jgi:hypothetical protein